MQPIEHNASTSSNRTIRLSLATAMAAALLAGCSGNPMSRTQSAASASAGAAPGTMLDSRQVQAIAQAEAAVMADPRNGSLRVALGNAYLDAGRFASAETAYADAMTLGESSPRAALSLALARIAQEKYAEGAAILNEYDGAIAKPDLGLALALAGQPERGIHIMSNAIRGGENTVKMRQNLAYAFAIAGRWRESRLMAQQDLPASEVAARMEHWAAMASADAYQHRIAGLLQVPASIRDSGQPLHLALGNSAGTDLLAKAGVEQKTAAGAEPGGELAALDTTEVPQLATASELAAFGIVQPAPMVPAALTRAPVPAADPAPEALDSFETAFAQSHTSGPQAEAEAQPSGTVRFISNPVVQRLPAGPTIAKLAAPAAGAPAADGSHLVQLGSFASERGAQRAWDIYVARFPELANHDLVISEAVVNGQRYWRVSAAGFARADSHAMCRKVRSSSSDGCVSWAASSPLPGAVDTGVRLARR